MTEWLSVMLEEIARKKREADEAREEQKRRDHPDEQAPPAPADQPK